MIKFNNSYVQLPEAFYSPIATPNTFRPTLIAFNHELAEELGIDMKEVSDEALAKYFSANEFMPGSNPIAMAYAGHQFGHFSPQLGDGRAMLLGEFIAKNGKRYDIHLKGSGRTIYSRRGDGRAALGPVLREYLVSEGMHALGIPSTRTLCATRTGELVYREEGELPGAVLTRTALGHIRVGTFEYFARRGDSANVKILADYTMQRLYPESANYFEFWKAVAMKQIKLVVQWMSFGFIHGVMNTDNMSISGETIDYGPCAFMDEFQFNKVFSSIDQNGRYAFANQPQIALWNLIRLAECLMPLMGKTEEEINAELGEFQKAFPQEFMQVMGSKLGIKNSTVADEELIGKWFQFMEGNKLDFTLSYIDLERYFEGKSTFTQIEKREGFEAFFASMKLKIEQEGRTLKEAATQMSKLNPLTIPRNHQIQKVIETSLTGNDEGFFKLLAVIKKPFERMDTLTDYQLPPRPEEVVCKTFCGT